LAIKW